jgi:hypothetical protein
VTASELALALRSSLIEGFQMYGVLIHHANRLDFIVFSISVNYKLLFINLSFMFSP